MYALHCAVQNLPLLCAAFWTDHPVRNHHDDGGNLPERNILPIIARELLSEEHNDKKHHISDLYLVGTLLAQPNARLPFHQRREKLAPAEAAHLGFPRATRRAGSP